MKNHSEWLTQPCCETCLKSTERHSCVFIDSALTILQMLTMKMKRCRCWRDAHGWRIWTQIWPQHYSLLSANAHILQTLKGTDRRKNAFQIHPLGLWKTWQQTGLRSGHAGVHVLQQSLSYSPATGLSPGSLAKEHWDALFTTISGSLSQADNKQHVKKQPASFKMECWLLDSDATKCFLFTSCQSWGNSPPQCNDGL